MRDERDKNPLLVYDEDTKDYRRRTTRKDLLERLVMFEESQNPTMAASIAEQIKNSDFDADHTSVAIQRARRDTPRPNPFLDRLTSEATFGFGPEISGAGANLRSRITGEGDPAAAGAEAETRFRTTQDRFEADRPGAALTASLLGGGAAGAPLGAAVGGGTLGRRVLAGMGPGALAGAGNAGPGNRLSGAATGGLLGGLAGGVAPSIAAGTARAGSALANRIAPKTVQAAAHRGKRFAERVAQARSFAPDSAAARNVVEEAAAFSQGMRPAEQNAFRKAVLTAAEEQVSSGAGEIADRIESARVAVMAVAPPDRADKVAAAFARYAERAAGTGKAANAARAALRTALDFATSTGGVGTRLAAAGLGRGLARRTHGVPFKLMREPALDISRLAPFLGAIGAGAGGQSQ